VEAADDLSISHVTINVDDPATNGRGIFTEVSSNTTVSDVTINLTGTPGFPRAVLNQGTLTMYRSSILNTTTLSTSVGVSHFSGATTTIYDSTIKITGGSTTQGVTSNGGTVSIFSSKIEGTGATGVDYGIQETTIGTTVNIDRSIISGDTKALVNGTASGVFNVGATQLIGGIDSSGGGTFNCIGVFDGAYAALGTSCI